MSKTSLPFSFQRCPLGLTRLVRGFHQRREESAEQARRRFFRGIFGILWVSVMKILSGVFSLQFLYKTDTLSHSFFARFANKFNDFARILLPSPSTCQLWPAHTSMHRNSSKKCFPCVILVSWWTKSCSPLFWWIAVLIGSAWHSKPKILLRSIRAVWEQTQCLKAPVRAQAW